MLELDKMLRTAIRNKGTNKRKSEARKLKITQKRMSAMLNKSGEGVNHNITMTNTTNCTINNNMIGSSVPTAAQVQPEIEAVRETLMQPGKSPSKPHPYATFLAKGCADGCADVEQNTNVKKTI
jgi:hypothetical protein